MAERTGPRVVLVGPPGAGKSSLGRLLAARLDCQFRDVDTDIARAAGKSIADIFTADGEPAFRELEQRAVAAALAEHRGVLALGGGAVLSAATRALLAGQTVLFCNVGVAEGVRRTGLSVARPLLAGVNPRATFTTMLRDRLPLYREVATVELATDGRDLDTLATEALARLGDTAADTATSR